jgi:2-methylcitrate dehydratase PrpD
MTNPMFTSHRLAAFVSGLTPSDIPTRVRNRAALNLLDTIASAAGGARSKNACDMRQAADVFFGTGPAPVWFTGARRHPAAALLANCAAASALDIDDGHRGASGHPGAAIVPAVLQEAMLHPERDPDIVGAIVIGYDVACRIAAARQPGTVKTYSAGRWVGYGVAAAIGWMRRLDPQTISHAMTIAGVESPENLPAGSYRRMSSVKGSSPWATLTAVVATTRAAAGADGPEDSLDRKDVYDAARICQHLGETWEIEQTYLKPYASCRYAHAATDAMLSLRRSDHAQAGGIERLVVEVFPEAFSITNETTPTTLEGAQFSIPFCVALAALRGASAFRPLQIESLRDPEVLALARHVEMINGEEFHASFPATTPSRVRLTQGGKEVLATVIHPLGDVANPMSWDQVEEKFHDLARATPGVPPEAVIAACRALAHGSLDAGGLRGALAG